MREAVWAEILKARRSRVPLMTVLAFAVGPLAGGFFMIVLEDPDLAQRMGMITAKAQILTGSADWQTHLGFLAQAAAIGGIVVFGFVATWVFGREFADATAADLLALPVSRPTIVIAKFVLMALWCVILAAAMCTIGLAVGLGIDLPGGSTGTIVSGAATVAVCALLATVVSTPIALVASIGRGYLPPLAATVLLVILAQLVAAAGWGWYFPWAVPALVSGMAGPEYAQVPVLGYTIVAVTSLAGIAGTLGWWEFADHTR